MGSSNTNKYKNTQLLFCFWAKGEKVLGSPL